MAAVLKKRALAEYSQIQVYIINVVLRKEFNIGYVLGNTSTTDF